MKIKNEKGMTLIVLIIIIIVLMILTSITISNFSSQLNIRNVNNLYSDIESLSTKISDYYLKNNSIPIYESNPYFYDSGQLSTLLQSKGESDDIINPNDQGSYYVIDLSKLENLTLSYGKQYKEWNDSNTYEDIQDVYIINAVTHQIYYPLGIRLGKKIYHTKGAKVSQVEKVASDIAEPEFSRQYGTIDIKFLSGTANKIIEQDKANKPIIKEGSNMVPVNYNDLTETWEETTQDEWHYTYENNAGTSEWANAALKDSNGNVTGYFVWIPRYAYKITYHDGSTEGDVLGYSDSRGIVNKVGEVITGAKSNRRNAGDNFIVHPAFTNNVDVGGWGEEIERNLGCKI